MQILKLPIYLRGNTFMYVNPAHVAAVIDSHFSDVCYIIMVGDTDGGVKIAMSSEECVKLLEG